MTRIRLAVPETAKKGEQIDIRALIQHKMESGYRYDARGQKIPRNIITSFECRQAEILLFKAEFGPGIAANPILSFTIKAEISGELVFRWTDQNGQTWQDTRWLNVL